jgi:hypothetical protein
VLVSRLLLSGTADARHVAGSAVPVFRHAIVIVFENHETQAVNGTGDAPTFDALGRAYARLTRYYGVTHPSLPNYLTLVSGSAQGITTDCTDCAVNARNLADTLEAAGKTWKTYAEGLPTPGFTGSRAGKYVKRHDPFLYFEDVVGDPARLSRVVPLSGFRADLRANMLPDFSLVVPDVCHDMHDCSVATGDRWLSSFVRPLLRSPKLAASAIFVIFDEGSSENHGGGHVPALVLGPLVRPGSSDRATLDHVSLLRTIEDAWGLPYLAPTAAARPITGIWR